MEWIRVDFRTRFRTPRLAGKKGSKCSRLPSGGTSHKLYRSGGEVPLRIYPGGIKTSVAWHEVPGKKKKDAPCPVGTVDQGFLQMCHSPFLGRGVKT